MSYFGRDLSRIFGHEGEAAQDILYVNWLNMVRAGVLGLEYYTPETKKWRQVSNIWCKLLSPSFSMLDCVL